MSSFIHHHFAKISFFLILCFCTVSISAQTPDPQPTVPPNVAPTVNPSPEIKKVEDPNIKSLNESRPFAPEFIIPARPTPNAERVGVEQMNQMSLQLDEAITLALQNNNNIDTSRLNVRIAEFNLKAARGVYDPLFASETFYQRATIPTASVIGGAAGDSVTQSSIGGNAGLTGFVRPGGGSYTANFTNSRNTTDNQNTLLNPQFPSSLTLTYAQPLFRGLRIDLNRRNIEIAKKNLTLTDAQFRQQVIEIVNQVEQAYWDLVFALRNLQVQIDAVKQARLQLESNQRMAEKGVIAPIGVVETTQQITTFEQNVFTAQVTVTQTENTLKTLILKDRLSDIWSRPLTPVTPLDVSVPTIPLNVAVTEAIKNRPEIQQLETNAEINKVNERYFRDQKKPQIDLVGTYTSNGLTGTANEVTRTGTPLNPLLLERINLLSANQGVSPLVVPPGTTVTAPPPSLVGGPFGSLADIFTNQYPTYRIGARISIPFGNNVAEADLGRTLVEGNQIRNQRAQTEQTIESEVRNAAQAIRSSEARLTSAQAARSAAEQLYESEQRQFRAGTTTTFLVLQRQTDLLNARSRELQAQTDLNKAISNFQLATGNTLTANRIDVTK
jgi:outer membrane protein